MSFRVESINTIEIFIGEDVLLINDLHNVIARNSLFEILATIWYKINFWPQNGKNCKLRRIREKDLGFIVAERRFLQMEKLLNFDKVEHWIPIVSRFWLKISSAIGYFRSWRKRVAVVENYLWKKIL